MARQQSDKKRELKMQWGNKETEAAYKYFTRDRLLPYTQNKSPEELRDIAENQWGFRLLKRQCDLNQIDWDALAEALKRGN